MKKLLYLMLVCIFLFFSGYRVQAQLYKVELTEKVKNAPLIIEGKVIDQKSFWNDAHTMIYTANTVELYKIFKGNETSKTIEVLTQGGTVGLDCIEVSDLLQLDKDKVGVFFCEPNRIHLKSPFTQKTLFDVYSSDQGFLRYDLERDFAYAPFVTYENIETNLYNILKQQTGLSSTILNSEFNIETVVAKNKALKSENVLATISSFSPTTVHSGALNDAANNQLTINGSGFGAVASGSCAIRFKDGNSYNQFPDYSIAYSSPYVVSWSDTKIVIKVPGRAATGTIAVVLSNGTAIESASTLNIFYGVSSTAGFLVNSKYYAGEPRMMNTNGNGGYNILYSTNTAGSGRNFATSVENATFKRALNTWKETVGVNFVEAGNTTIQLVTPNSGQTDDRQNVIMLDNLNTSVPPLPDGTLASTYNYYSACVSGSGIAVPQKTGFDMIIRNAGVSVGNYQFEPGPCTPASTNQNYLDLETVLLHELGHTMNLTHVNLDGEGSIPNLNPSAIMHYAISNYTARRSPDNSAFSGTTYTLKKQNNIYGSCGLFPSEMTQLTFTTIATDECPVTFPTTATPAGTVVNFDLVHATSNRSKDPKYTGVNCANTGTSVTNNTYFAFRTGSTSNGSLTISITGYTTTPSTLTSCSGQGIRIAVYDVSTCPAGQAFPAPIACRTFAADGPVTSITNLAANHTYLIYFDGIKNTKAVFNATFNGTALPVTISKFTGEFINGKNQLNIELLQAVNVKNISIEKSADGVHFTAIGDLPYTTSALLGKHTYLDAQPFAGNNYYRLNVINNDGSAEYSNIILLKNDAKRLVYVYPNPVKDVLNISITATTSARYNCYLYDVSGRLLISKVYNVVEGRQTLQMPFGRMAKGAYTIKVVDADGNIVARQNIIH